MAVIDIIILCVLVLFGIIGMVKGFLNTIISLFGNLASLAIAIFCAKPVSGFLDKVFNIVSGIGGSISNSLAPTIKPFESGYATQTMSGANLKEYFASDGLSFQERLFGLFIDDGATFATDLEVTQYIGNYIAGIAALIIAVVVMFILIRVAIMLLAKLFDALTKNKAIGGLDRAMGLLVGLAKGALLVTLVLGVFYLIANTTVDGWIQNSVITKWLYQYVCQLVDWAVTKFDLPDVIRNLFPVLQG